MSLFAHVLRFLCAWVGSIGALRLTSDNHGGALPMSSAVGRRSEENGQMLPREITDGLSRRSSSHTVEGAAMEASGAQFAATTVISLDMSGRPNLCMGGHMVPELFVLGAQKASTTKLCGALLADFMHIVTPKREGILELKEMHFFDQRENTLAKKSSWLMKYPKCEHDRRTIAMDCTPSYLRTDFAPELISSYYGELKDKIKFTILLREPVRRAQSAFSFIKEGKQHVSTVKAQDCLGAACELTSFQDFVTEFLNSGKDVRDIIRGGLYNAQIQRYFNTFNSSQFTIVPMKYNVAPGKFHVKETVVQSLRRTLGVPDSILSLNDLPFKINPSDHGSLDEELDPSSQAALASYFLQNGDGLEKIAATLSSSNAKLFGYHGEPGDTNAITEWLAKGW